MGPGQAVNESVDQGSV